MMKNILLIGLGRFGKHIAIQSSQLGHEIMAVDLDEERVNDALPYVTNAQIGDSTNEEFLKSLGIANYDICFVTIGGNFQNSLETTCLLKELGGKMVISRAERDVQEKFLLRNGADKVVYPEKMVAKWATIRYTDDHILDYMAFYFYSRNITTINPIIFKNSLGRYTWYCSLYSLYLLYISFYIFIIANLLSIGYHYMTCY